VEQFFDPSTIEAYWTDLRTWAETSVLTWGVLIQIVAIGVAYTASLYPSRFLRRLIEKIANHDTLFGPVRAVLSPLVPLAFYLTWMLLQWLMVAVAVQAEWPHRVVQSAASLLTAWIVIRYATSMLRDPAWSHFVALVVWTIAALNIVGLLDDTIAVLDGLALNLGEFRLSALVVIKALLALGVLLWIAMLAARLLERRISSSPNLTPSVQVLITKLMKATFVVIAVVAALTSVGIDLSAFAIFGGALGVGLGFGLQRVVSNLVSGIILLIDKSIKPGDVIAVAGTYGWVKSMGARYASVVTRDGIEHLIPNEELITTRVENWSYSDRNVRLKLPIGIAYDADIRKAMELCLEAAGEVKRVLSRPEPRCLLIGFGDSAIDLELRIWIADANQGIRNVSSDVQLLVWDKFQEHGIGIPFPQRDVHIKNPEKLAAALGLSAET